MEWLNYHHLFYFWTVARAGSISRASEELRLAQPTISNQLKTLEANLGVKLLERQGRRLVITDEGRTVLRFADDIFRTGRELQRAVKGLPTGQGLRLVAGVVDVIPKRMAALLLQPAIDAHPDLVLVCREGPLPQLLGALALHDLDVVIADVPASEEVKVKAFNHRLGDCGTSFLAAPRHAGLRKGFPRSLDGAPLLVPAPGSALLKAFGARGFGVFAVPSVLEDEIRAQYGVQVVGRADDVREAFYAITVERRLRHPAVVAVAETARHAVFAPRAAG